MYSNLFIFRSIIERYRLITMIVVQLACLSSCAANATLTSLLTLFYSGFNASAVLFVKKVPVRVYTAMYKFTLHTA